MKCKRSGLAYVHRYEKNVFSFFGIFGHYFFFVHRKTLYLFFEYVIILMYVQTYTWVMIQFERYLKRDREEE